MRMDKTKTLGHPAYCDSNGGSCLFVFEQEDPTNWIEALDGPEDWLVTNVLPAAAMAGTAGAFTGLTYQALSDLACFDDPAACALAWGMGGIVTVGFDGAMGLGTYNYLFGGWPYSIGGGSSGVPVDVDSPINGPASTGNSGGATAARRVRKIRF